MNYSNTTISFRIDIDFPDCDVDAVFSEVSRNFISEHKVKGKRTPTAGSVDMALDFIQTANWNGDNYLPELKEIGVEVKETYGLMMGCCHFWCTVDASKFTMDLPDRVIKIVKPVFRKLLRYHKPNKELRSGGMIFAK